MALSEDERVALEQLEKQFRAEDPNFAKAMQPARSRSGLHIVVGVAGVVAGLLLVLLGAVLPGAFLNILVGVLGFAVMIAGGHFALRHTSASRNNVPSPIASPAESVGDEKPVKDRRSFKDGFGDMALWSLFWWV